MHSNRINSYPDINNDGEIKIANQFGKLKSLQFAGTEPKNHWFYLQGARWERIYLA